MFLSKKVQKQEQKKNNDTGIPTQLKQKFEDSSGFSFDDVRVNYNSSKPEGLGALAYTQGNQVYIGAGQERHLEHELVHVIQQKQGRVHPTLDINGFAVNDDPALEREADAHMDMISKKEEQIITPVIQRYSVNSKFKHHSDDSYIMNVDPSGTDKHFFAWKESDVVEQANGLLKHNIRLKVLGSERLTIQDEEFEYDKVTAESTINGKSGKDLNIYADCGKAAREVIGENPHAIINKTGETDATEKTTGASSVGIFEEKIIDKILEDLKIQGIEKSKAKEIAEKLYRYSDYIHEKYGLNQYADPKVGEGFVIKSGGEIIPGKKSWNFHWGAVVAESGSDKVTLENYAVGDASVTNSKWNFDMVGTKKGESFHQKHKKSELHRKDPVTMRVG